MYTLQIPFASPLYDDTVRLRDEVLRQPLGLTFFAEDLAKEYNQIHLACYSNQQKLIGCLVLQPLPDKELKMRQVAVEPALQKKGIGQFLVTASEDYAHKNGYAKMVLHARDTAIPFYTKLGYKKIGRAFKEVNIKHYKMEKTI